MGQLRVLLHSLAFGTLKLFVAEPMKEAVTQVPDGHDPRRDGPQPHLLDAGAWSGAGSWARGGRIYAMTSAGGTRVLPYYGPVSAAKAALESNIRQLAAELAPRGITANSIRAGVTATPAAQKIPNYEEFSGRRRARAIRTAASPRPTTSPAPSSSSPTPTPTGSPAT